jgi:putative transposase
MTTTPTRAADQSAAPGPLRVGFIVGRPQGRGSRAPTPVLDLAGLDRAIGEFIGTYNDRSHSELGISPRDAWVSDGWLPRMPDSLQELDGLLLTVPKNRVVQRDGIHFQGQRYLAPTLAPFVGHTITIRDDPRDILGIRVYDRDTFICTAIDEAHPNLRLSLRDIETARRARRKQLRRAINDRIPTVATREEPRIPEPTKRRPMLRTYEEDE